MADELDHVQFGRLIQSVETLTAQVNTLTVKVDTMANQFSGGKGIVAGLMLASGGIGAGATHLLDRLLK